MRRLLRTLPLLLLVSLVLAGAPSGCVVIKGPVKRVASAPRQSSEPTSAIDWTGSHGKRVLVLGHRFARDWFAHWGWQGSGPVARQGVSLFFGDLDRAPKGAVAMRKHVGEAPKDVVVFYMAGPETLEGGSAKASRASVKRLLAEVDLIAASTKARKLQFVAGGPLPSLAGDTDAALVDAQQRYLKELRARERKGLLTVFDAYEDMSSAGEVTLVRGYARTPGESRLGPAGFEALDEEFFPFLREQF